jgi:hypothetical protein
MTGRNHFALARLIAFCVRLPPRPQSEKVILAIDRHQSAAENYAVCIWFMATTTCFIAAYVPWILAFPLALIAVQIPISATGLVFNNPRVNGAFLMLCATVAALYFASQPAWQRFVAYVFLGVLALNAIAFVILWLLRRWD